MAPNNNAAPGLLAEQIWNSVAMDAKARGVVIGQLPTASALKMLVANHEYLCDFLRVLPRKIFPEVAGILHLKFRTVHTRTDRPQS